MAFVATQRLLAEGISGKTVMELGCGTGLISVAAALGGATFVLATDRSTPNLELTRASARLNGCGHRVLRAELFDVGLPFPLPTASSPLCGNLHSPPTRPRCAKELPSRYDFLVMSDVLYWEETPAFARRMVEAVKAGGTVIAADNGRRRTDFFQALRAELARQGMESRTELDVRPARCPDAVDHLLSSDVKAACTGMFVGSNDAFELVMRPRAEGSNVPAAMSDVIVNADVGVLEVGPHLVTGPFKYQAAAVGGNGKVYAIPFGLATKRVLEFDPSTGRLEHIGEELAEGNARYVAAVTAGNGLVFAIPCNARRTLQIDPSSGDVREVGREFPYGGLKYQDAVVGTNGRIYGIPFNARRFLEVNPATGDTAEVGPELPNGGFKYLTGIAAPNGCVYALPFDAARVLEFNPATGNAREIGPEFSQGNAKYVAAALAPGGRIYAVPCSARRVLEVCPSVGDAREIGPELQQGFKYQSAAVGGEAFGGRVYGIPFDASRVLEVDPATNEIREIGPELPGKGDRYGIAVAAQGGRVIFGVPCNASRVLAIELGDVVSQTTECAVEPRVRLVGQDLYGPEDRYQAGVVAGDGRVYAVPYNATRVLEIGPLQCSADRSRRSPSSAKESPSQTKGTTAPVEESIQELGRPATTPSTDSAFRAAAQSETSTPASAVSENFVTPAAAPSEHCLDEMD
eukprot:TRINITY_DN31077_c0_g1_i1.p1 TRINITY_DN31077_c0_g1~~TRINITY_DN31077_c0_g1_i1.p1  ORF type:complete len:805 (+),score=119.24 TRINITY_DN31077_c0_g1_i1:349-2415(+)